MGNFWENPVKPVKMGNGWACPMCGSALIGPFAATMPDNSILRKTCCSNPQCTYIARTEDGFKTAQDANPVAFK